MTQNNQAPPGILSGGNMTLQQMYDAGLNLMQGICSIVTQPIECGLRPHFGTRYFNPVTTFFSCVLMFLLMGVGAFSSITPSFPSRSMPPASHHGLIGLTTLCVLFFIGNVIHGPRLYRRMLHPERERHSEYEGPALPLLTPLFALLPQGVRFWPVRIVYEPLTVVALSATLSLLGVLDRRAALYLCIAAVLLTVKCSLEWFRAWLYVRILLDGQAAAPVIAAVIKGTATEEDMAQVHIAGFPKSVSPEIKAAAIAQRTGNLPPDIASLVSPVAA